MFTLTHTYIKNYNAIVILHFHFQVYIIILRYHFILDQLWASIRNNVHHSRGISNFLFTTVFHMLCLCILLADLHTPTILHCPQRAALHHPHPVHRASLCL